MKKLLFIVVVLVIIMDIGLILIIKQPFGIDAWWGFGFIVIGYIAAIILAAVAIIQYIHNEKANK